MAVDTFIAVPDVLGTLPVAAERFLDLLPVATAPPFHGFDLSSVTWVRPFGAVVLLHACLYVARLLGVPVRFVGLRDPVHAYLRRIDFFEHAGRSVYAPARLAPASMLSRSSASSNVLEFFPIRCHADVLDAARHARQILGCWLGGAQFDIDNLVVLLSEACSNVVDHSRDVGILTIQKYECGTHTDVELAIGDTGCSIRRSLYDAHGDVATTPSGFIRRALAGMTARPGRAVGHGLADIRRIATMNGGLLYLRSDTGGVLAQQAGGRSYDRLAALPGTQIGVTFRSIS